MSDEEGSTESPGFRRRVMKRLRTMALLTVVSVAVTVIAQYVGKKREIELVGRFKGGRKA